MFGVIRLALWESYALKNKGSVGDKRRAGEDRGSEDAQLGE